MAIELLCRKIGMTRIFDETGRSVPVTVLEAGPNVVVQKKAPERDGYSALQLGFQDRKRQRLTKPLLGHFEKVGVAPKRYLAESRLSDEDAASYEVGQEIKADIFEVGQKVDVIATSKGRGTAGTVKRHGFSIKKRTHGTHEGFRNPGSIGAGAYPGRVIKGMRMAGRHGNERVTVRNLRVARVEPERNLLLLHGAVPGPGDGLVRVRTAVAPRKLPSYNRKDSLNRRAKSEGYRSRAAYKLLEIQAKYRVLRPGLRVLDLGCWPGGWLQVAAAEVGAAGRVVGIDRATLEVPLDQAQVVVLEGDLTASGADERLLEALGGLADVVLCDAAPKLTGIRATDRAREEALLEAIIALLPRVLRPDGTLVLKLFEGPEARRVVEALRRRFRRAEVHGLRASRKSSAERYLLGRGFRGEGRSADER